MALHAVFYAARNRGFAFGGGKSGTAPEAWEPEARPLDRWGGDRPALEKALRGMSVAELRAAARVSAEPTDHPSDFGGVSRGVRVGMGEPTAGRVRVRFLERLPCCILTPVEHVDSAKETLCPDDSYKNFFYHLGYIHSDSNLLRHGAQDVVVQLLAAFKQAEGCHHIENSVE
ncbi:hypothetical protein KFL_001560040 [Klebsormidium nitens]|uniref:Uncharacterized protein n=1 Tax=Klebsormidium nitens TaxID=105231 RepID=A0A1Y1HYA7_KLENI|nr:hypothetical protein KFL_001560040 [Klebsormidium nitens]|eukprot:GAQ83635.1 hypothetical protein KFL_001560040 [Klebsormidium nitens]